MRPSRYSRLKISFWDDVDAIIIDPISASALTGAIQEASDAGIPCIIINDGPVESDAELCYQITLTP